MIPSQPPLSYILQKLIPPTTPHPSFKQAMQYRRLNSPLPLSNYGDTGHNTTAHIQDAFTFKTHVFKKYGSGVYLYFSLIEMLFITFVVISLNSLPVFLSNFKGNGLKIYGGNSLAKGLMGLSLGNQREEHYQSLLTNQNIRLDIQISQTLVILVDIINSIIFFTFLIYWKIKSDKIVSELVSEDALPSYYTLQITNLPKNYNEESIMQHFYKFGADVAQVSTVYHYEDVLEEVKKLIKLVDQYALANNPQKQLIYHKIDQHIAKVRNMTKLKKPKPVVSFVTFEDMIMKKKIKDLYKYRICPRQLRYEGKMIKISNCRVQPTSILWQNYHLQTKTQIRQSILISIILILILFVALLALFLANAHATSMLEQQSAMSTKFNYAKKYTLEQAKLSGTTQAIFVFCSYLTYHDLSLDTFSFCQPYFSLYKQRFGVMMALSGIVVTINCILNWSIWRLANYRRYKTKTQKSRFLILNIFMLYFINSGLLMLLIRVEIGGYSLSKLILSFISLPASQFSIQSYPDFTRKWYINIGSQIVMIHAVSLILSPFIQIVLNWFQAQYRAFQAKRKKTQALMNQTLMDSQFDFETFYAMMLNACFFTMFHGNAIPLLYVLAIGAFFSLYVASYIVFRYFSCRPVLFDHTLNAVISRVMCIALIMHQLTSIMYFYAEDIFPMAAIADVSSHYNSYQNYRKNRNKDGIMFHKFQQGLPFIILMAFFIVCTFNYNRVCRMAKKYFYKHFVPGYKPIKQPKLFSEVFGQPLQLAQPSQSQAKNQGPSSPSLSPKSPTSLASRSSPSPYLCSFRMCDNPNYKNISSALQILSILQPYFKATPESSGGTRQSRNRPMETSHMMQNSLMMQTSMRGSSWGKCGGKEKDLEAKYLEMDRFFNENSSDEEYYADDDEEEELDNHAQQGYQEKLISIQEEEIQRYQGTDRPLNRQQF